MGLQQFTAATHREQEAAPDGLPCDVTIVAHDVGAVGGMERQLTELIRGLRERGHEVTVIAWTCDLPADVTVQFHRVPGPRRPFLVGYLWFLVAGSLVVRRRRRGIVQSTGAIVVNRIDAIAVHCCHRVYTAMPNEPTPVRRFYAIALTRVKRAVERLCFSLNGEAALVCVSEGVAQEIRDHYPGAAGHVLTIHNGVDTAAFAPGARATDALALRSSLTIGEGRMVAAFVGGDWEHKGLGLLIEALAHAPEWDLVVAGQGPRSRFQALAVEHGVQDAVHWLGVVNDMPVVYELADAFVLPSSYETFSLVTFEAAANGLPIVATAVSGISELIESGSSGFLIGADPRLIADRLLELGADPALRQRLGEAARRSALRYSWQDMVGKHDDLYASLARRSRP